MKFFLSSCLLERSLFLSSRGREDCREKEQNLSTVSTLSTVSAYTVARFDNESERSSDSRILLQQNSVGWPARWIRRRAKTRHALLFIRKSILKVHCCMTGTRTGVSLPVGWASDFRADPPMTGAGQAPRAAPAVRLYACQTLVSTTTKTVTVTVMRQARRP